MPRPMITSRLLAGLYHRGASTTADRLAGLLLRGTAPRAGGRSSGGLATLIARLTRRADHGSAVR